MTKKKVARVAMAFPAFYGAFKKFIPTLECINPPDVRRMGTIDLISEYDMLIFSGGEDVSPNYYGERLEFSDITNGGRDDIEMTIAKAGLTLGKKMFGICRGLQLLNVACGGSLWQDISLSVGSPGSHPYMHGWERLGTHPFMDKVEEIPKVNSMHHQGIKRYGNSIFPLAGFKGLPEIIAGKDNRILAVQWHPEFMDCTQTLFDYLTQEWVFDTRKAPNGAVPYDMNYAKAKEYGVIGGGGGRGSLPRYMDFSGSATTSFMTRHRREIRGQFLFEEDDSRAVEGVFSTTENMISHNDHGEINLEGNDGQIYFLPDDDFMMGDSVESIHRLNAIARNVQGAIHEGHSLASLIQAYSPEISNLLMRTNYFVKAYIKKNIDNYDDPDFNTGEVYREEPDEQPEEGRINF
jgi:putative glutamine amidotransferase